MSLGACMYRRVCMCHCLCCFSACFARPAFFSNMLMHKVCSMRVAAWLVSQCRCVSLHVLSHNTNLQANMNRKMSWLHHVSSQEHVSFHASHFFKTRMSTGSIAGTRSRLGYSAAGSSQWRRRTSQGQTCKELCRRVKTFNACTT